MKMARDVRNGIPRFKRYSLDLTGSPTIDYGQDNAT